MNLSKEALEMIKLAGKNGGSIEMLSTDQKGNFLRIGSKYFYDELDPTVRIKAIEIVQDLCDKGIISPEGERLFVLTTKGFEIAHNLSS